MRSIRLSLILFFLVLLASALGAVGGLFYATTEATLVEKKDSTSRLYVQEFESRRNEVLADFDQLLLRQAQLLAGQTRSSTVFYEILFPLGALGSPGVPHGWLNMPLWFAEGANPKLAFSLYRMRPLDIFVPTAEVESLEDPFREPLPTAQYFQVYRFNGKTLQRSESLGTEKMRLEARHRKLELLQETFDDVSLRSGVKLRRVTFKAAVPVHRRSEGWGNFWRFPGRFSRPGSGPGRMPFPTPPPRPSIIESPVPVFYIQVAGDTASVEKTIAGFRDEMTGKSALLESDTTRSLKQLRNRLFLIGLVTFGMVLLGCLILVGVGLSPLRRLSDAVSRVTPKDFRLPLKEEEMPVELQPIVSRLTDSLASLGKAFEREKQAAADISHELRTPLAALLTNLEVALRKERSPREYQEVLEECRASGQQMYRLVEQLLVLARLDAGAVRLRREPVDVADLARQCVGLVRPLAEARGLAMHVAADRPQEVQADPDKVREVLNNLLHNAIEYNRPDGEIDLRVEREDGHVRVEVRDTGIGIAEEVRQHIFERFWRADPSRQADTPHAGLGLSIVKSYVDLMGGRIEVDSNGTGSTFRVELPVSDNQGTT